MAEEKEEKTKKTEKTPKAERKSAPAQKPAEASEGGEEQKKTGEEAVPPRRKKKGKKNVVVGVAHISVTFNNTIVSLTDPQGNVVGWASGGTVGFAGTKKGTPYAATKAAEMAAKKAMDHGMRRVVVLVKGPGPGREAAVQGLQAAGLQVMYIKDITPIPHNGCRPPKRRRV